MDIEILFNSANVLYLIGTIFLIRRVVENRSTLKDFDPTGSMINFIGIFVNAIALIGLGYYMTVTISIPTMMFWLIVSIYSIKNRNLKKGLPANKSVNKL